MKLINKYILVIYYIELKINYNVSIFRAIYQKVIILFKYDMRNQIESIFDKNKDITFRKYHA